MKKQKPRATRTHYGVIIGIIALGALIFLMTLALPLVQPQNLRTGEPTADGKNGIFLICQYDRAHIGECYPLTEEPCRRHSRCEYFEEEERCVSGFEYFCRVTVPRNYVYSKLCIRDDGEALPLISDTRDCRGPGSDTYNRYGYIRAGHGPFINDFIEKTNNVIKNVTIENTRFGHSIASVTITNLGCCTFSDVPARQFIGLSKRIMSDIYRRWNSFEDSHFPSDFRVTLRANQMSAWLPILEPHFTIGLRQGIGMEYYSPVDCEEISGSHDIEGGHGDEAICSNHSKKEECERQRLVNPGGELAYFEFVSRSTCDGTTDLEP